MVLAKFEVHTAVLKPIHGKWKQFQILTKSKLVAVTISVLTDGIHVQLIVM